MGVEVKIPRDCIPLLGRAVTGEPGWPDLFYKAQRGFSYDPQFISFFLGGNGTGKTRLGSWNVVAQACGVHPRQLGEPPLRLRAIAPTFEDGVKKIMLPKLYEDQGLAPNVCEAQGLKAGSAFGPMLPRSMVEKNFDDKNRVIKFKNGSVLEFMTHDQSVLQHAGAERDGIWCDEEPPKKLWSENKARLRHAKGGGKIWLTMTPPYDPTAEPPWTGTELYEGRPPNVGVYTAAMADNPAITQDFIDDFTMGMTEDEVQVRVYGRYPSFGKVVYPHFVDSYHDDPERPGNLIRHFQIPGIWGPRLAAIDYHASKACAMLWGVTDPEDNVYIFAELADKDTEDQPIRVLADLIRKKEGSRPPDWRVFDPSGHHPQKGVRVDWTPIQEFQKYGIGGSNARTNWESGWSTVNQYLMATHKADTVVDRDHRTGRPRKHPKIYIFDTCAQLRWSLKHHVWAQRGQKKEPHQKGKDLCDCLRYIVMEHPQSFARRKAFWEEDYAWEPPRKHTAGLWGAA